MNEHQPRYTKENHPPHSIRDGAANLQELDIPNKIPFDVLGEVARLSFNYYQKIQEGVNPDVAAGEALREVRGNLVGYVREMLEEFEFVYNPLYIDTYKGRERIFGRFSNRPIADTIDTRERLGSVADAINHAEDFLLAAPPNSIWVMASPNGETGLPSKNGGTLVYERGQLQLWWKNLDGSIEGGGLVQDLNMPQHRELLKRLGLDISGLVTKGSYLTQAADIVRHPVTISGTVYDVINTLEGVMLDGVADRKLHRRLEHNFIKLRQEIMKRKSQSTLDPQSEALVSYFEQQARTWLSDTLTLMEELSLGELNDQNIALVKSMLAKDQTSRLITNSLTETIQKLCLLRADPSTPVAPEVPLTEQQSSVATSYAESRQGWCPAGEKLNNGLGSRSVTGDRTAENGWHQGICQGPLHKFEYETSKRWVGPCDWCEDCEDHDNEPQVVL